jgi:Cft2 family RNA processing exonuclease
MLVWANGLRIGQTQLYLDSRTPRKQSVISHAHSDHIARHEETIATQITSQLVQKRIGVGMYRQLEYSEQIEFSEGMVIKLLPAGHILGSAMVKIDASAESLLYTGDFKLRPSLTAGTAEPEKADVLVMESTYGQPFFRFPPWQLVAEELVQRVSEALRSGRQPIVLGYSLGKAQEITRILTDAGLAVTLHGAVLSMHEIYEQNGVRLGPVRRYAAADFHGPKALDLAERGVLVAPPQVARSGFVTRFENPLRIIMTGWALLKNANYRYGVDHALPLSDHADFDELLELIDRVSPTKIYTHHGYREFADLLQARGHDAQPAEPDRQLLLFDRSAPASPPALNDL